MKKMKLIKRLLLLLTVAFLVVFFFSAMYKDEQSIISTIPEPNPSVSPKDVVQLKICVVGKKYPDFDAVQEQVNVILRKEIGAEIKVDFIEKSTATESYTAIFAGEHNVNLIDANVFYDYKIWASRQAYMPITENMMKLCAPKTYEKLSPRLLEQLKYHSRLYMVPSTVERSGEYVVLARGDLMERYGVESLTDVDELEHFLRQIRDNEDIMPYDVGSVGHELLQAVYLQPRSLQMIDSSLLALDFSGKKPEIVWLPEYEGFAQYLRMVQRWRGDDLIPENAAARKPVAEDSFIQGRSAIYICRIEEAMQLQSYIDNSLPRYNPRIFDISGERAAWCDYEPLSGFAVVGGSHNAAKSLAFIEQLSTNEKVYRLLNYGVEGYHYQLEDGKYIPTEHAGRYPAGNNRLWQFTEEFALENRLQRADGLELLKRYQSSESKLRGFGSFSIDPDANTIGLIDKERVNIRYIYPLTLGAFDDIVLTIEKSKNELSSAGFFEYMKNGRSQLAKYLQENGGE
ncbi:hypothetical protein [Hydrogenoanaerobacterium sp.]|uniref:hypothetical protein n=1 Tax=Hydrogenoanaerobacterium sp. TaxID=2953763 RepID=UPI00289E9D52|nr:hypothetical protein [Hydrogenoanaerobacterium sp.]